MGLCVFGSKLETPVRGSGLHENRLKGFIQLSSPCRQSLLSDSKAIQKGLHQAPLQHSHPQFSVDRLVCVHCIWALQRLL